MTDDIWTLMTCCALDKFVSWYENVYDWLGYVLTGLVLLLGWVRFFGLFRLDLDLGIWLFVLGKLCLCYEFGWRSYNWKMHFFVLVLLLLINLLYYFLWSTFWKATWRPNINGPIKQNLRLPPTPTLLL